MVSECPKGHGPLRDLDKPVPWCDSCAWTPPGVDLELAETPDDNQDSAFDRPDRRFRTAITKTGSWTHLTQWGTWTFCGRAVYEVGEHWNGQRLDDTGIKVCDGCFAAVGLGPYSRSRELELTRSETDHFDRIRLPDEDADEVRRRVRQELTRARHAVRHRILE